MKTLHSHTRRRYDTTIPLLFINEKEHLLPEAFRRGIPSSTISTWRKEKQKNFHGNEFRKITDEGLEWAELIWERDHLKKTLRTIARIWIASSKLFFDEKQNQRKFRSKIITVIRDFEHLLPRKLLLNIFRVPIGTYHYFHYAGHCAKSIFRLCLMHHPCQLSVPEVRKMKLLLADDRFVNWPIVSLALFARRNKIIAASNTTWYNFCRRIGIKRKRLVREQKKKGIVSTRPNEFLHVDTTYIETPDRKKVGITFVTDNFSKMILGVSVGWGISFLRIKEALAMALKTIKHYHPQTERSILVSDGEPENTAIGVKEFLNALEHPEIDHRIGLKTIEFSNSPVEAINKIMKQYLRRQAFYSPGQTLNFLENHAIPDYNEIRPHISLNGLTPMESYCLKSLPLEWERPTRNCPERKDWLQ